MKQFTAATPSAGDTAATSELVTDIGHVIRSRVQRRRLRTRRVHLESATEAQKLASLREATVDAPRVACATEHRQLLDRLKRTLAARLSEKGMAVYQLLFIEELSVEDVEARLALNASAIYTWRHRIRSQLAQVQAQLDGVHESGWPQHTRRAARAA